MKGGCVCGCGGEKEEKDEVRGREKEVMGQFRDRRKEMKERVEEEGGT